jgi:hypothetical protein
MLLRFAALPEQAWSDLLRRDGAATDTAGVAELTGLDTRTEQWIEGLRLIVRRIKPSRRHKNRLTALEKRTGWRYAVVATNITRVWGVPGSHHPQWIDVLRRSRASVEDRVRTNKAMGLRNLPSQSWAVNRGWVPGGQPRRRHPGMDPIVGSARPARPGHRRTGNPALPAAAPTRQTDHPRPPPLVEHPRGLAVSPGVPAVLVAPEPTDPGHLTRNKCPTDQEKTVSGSETRRTRSDPRGDHAPYRKGQTVRPNQSGGIKTL